MTEATIPDAIREVFLHLMAQHHRIVTLYDMWYADARARTALIEVERMSLTLADALECSGKDINNIAVLRDIAAALAHLHERGIVHGDIKPASILLNKECTQAKLAGFGSSRRRSIGAMTTMGTPQAGNLFYMAPELRETARRMTTMNMDCWAFGLLICVVMNASGRNAVVDAHHADLHGAAQTWASGIGDKHVRVAAVACVQREAEDRPLMKEVYRHLTGAVPIDERLAMQRGTVAGEVPHDGVGKSLKKEVSSDIVRTGAVSGKQRVNQAGWSQEMSGSDWKNFSEVNPSWNSLNGSGEIYVVNDTEGGMDLRKAQVDGGLWLHVDQSASGRLTKTEGDGGVFFVLRDVRTYAFCAAFAVKAGGRSVAVGPNYVHFHGSESNEANKGEASWPLRSAASSEQVPLAVDNDWPFCLCVQRVDDSGREAPLVEKIGWNSKWTGRVLGGSVLVFRRTCPGEA